MINWAEEARELTLDFRDVGILYAAEGKSIWREKVVSNVKTAYTSNCAPSRCHAPGTRGYHQGWCLFQQDLWKVGWISCLSVSMFSSRLPYHSYK